MQNFYMLEQLAGLGEATVIAAHGNFAKASSLQGRPVPVGELKDAVFEGTGACLALTEKYGSLVKPDIVFFGEELPKRFFQCRQSDFPKCDLLLVFGTSLVVAPVNHLIRKVPRTCPRVLINREPAGEASWLSGGSCFKSMQRQDVLLQGDCDTHVQDLCIRLGWVAALGEICGWPFVTPVAPTRNIFFRSS